jgi:hypothetical protein
MVVKQRNQMETQWARRWPWSSKQKNYARWWLPNYLSNCNS